MREMENKTIKINKKIREITWDTETLLNAEGKSNWGYLWSSQIYDGKEVKYIMDKNQSMTNDEIIHKTLEELFQNNDLIWVHNLSFDIRFIYEYIQNHPDKIKVTSLKQIHGRTVKMRIVYISDDGNKKKLTFRDTLILFPSSLRSLAEAYQVTSKEYMNYEAGPNDENAEKYISADVISLYEILQKSPELTQKLTLPGNAMNIFLNDFYIKEHPDFDEKNARNSLKIESIFRLSYYGGRTEIFKPLVKDKPIYDSDVNSLYPAVMEKNKFPLFEKNNYRIVTPGNYEKGKLGIYKIRFRTPENIKIPLLPVHDEGKLIFPKTSDAGTASITGWYCTPEIEKALSIGYKIEFLGGYVFDKTDYIFKSFVDKYYQMKRTSTGAKHYEAKILMNSLYGKTGQASERETLKLITKAEYEKLINKEKRSKFFKLSSNQYLFSKKEVDTHTPYLHVEIASFVTSYARVALYEIMERVGFDAVIYTDTDSVFTTVDLRNDKDWYDENELGKLKNEGYGNNFVALQPKVYILQNRSDEKMEQIVKAKGFPKSALKDFTFELFEDIIRGKRSIKELEGTYSSPITFRTSKIQGKKVTDEVVVVKHMNSIYDKRIVTKNLVTGEYDTYPRTCYTIDDNDEE